MHSPYIGITDFTDYSQVEQMLAVFKKHLVPGQTHRLHVGVMMSQKTLNGIETKWAKAFPPSEKIAQIFGSRDPLVMNCLHYADYDNVDVWHNLVKAIFCGGRYLKAIQLDMVWPNPNDICGAVRATLKSLEVILQVGKNAIEQANNDPKEVVRRLQPYRGIIQHVLLDKSMGQGLGMDAGALRPFVRAIRDNFPNFGVTVAGGLGPSSLGLVEPLVREFPGLSIDAQGKLRPSGSALDPIDWDMAGKYLAQASLLLC